MPYPKTAAIRAERHELAVKRDQESREYISSLSLDDAQRRLDRIRKEKGGECRCEQARLNARVEESKKAPPPEKVKPEKQTSKKSS